MKKTILATLLMIALAITTTSNAQVGIGVSTANINPSAQLDVSSTTKGFLPPRMTTTQRDAISTPATGLVIFNTTTNSLEYRSSTGWVQLTTGGVPYTGATGAVDLGNYNLTVNGITVGLGGATAGTNTAIGYLAQSAANGGQGHNTAIGAYSLQANAGGYNNTAVGDQALNTLQTGHENSAFGKWSLQYSNGSNYNSGIGFSALRNNTSGNYNTGLGTEAGLANTTGTNNTFLGYGANSNSGSLTNATAIGNWAIVDASNKIQLGNGSVTNVKTSGTITAGTITYPNTDGTANQVLSTNGSGVVSWATAASGVSSIGAIGGSSTSTGASISGSALSLTPADGTNGGIVTNAAQTFAGKKTFADSAVAKGFRATDSLITKGFRATGNVSASTADIDGQAGIGTVTPDASAKLDVSSTIQGFLPPRMTAVQRDAIVSPAYGLMLFCTNCGTHGEPEFYNGIAWVNLIGETHASPQIAPGTTYQGGIVFYNLLPTDPGYNANIAHGLIAATEDQGSTGIQWYNGSYINISTGTALGTGLANTNAIITAQGGTISNYAAGIAQSYNGGSYTDWYLPSKDELYKLFLNKNLVPGLTNKYYWSSSQNSPNYIDDAWYQLFNNGSQAASASTTQYPVFVPLDLFNQG